MMLATAFFDFRSTVSILGLVPVMSAIPFKTSKDEFDKSSNH